MNRSVPTMQQIAEAFNYSEKIDKTAVAAVIRTKQDIIIGYLHVRPIVRIIDELLNAKKFLAVTNATVYDIHGKVLFRTNFLAINRDDVTYIIPRHEMPGYEEEKADGKNPISKRIHSKK